MNTRIVLHTLSIFLFIGIIHPVLGQECPSPGGLAVVSTSGSSADLSWSAVDGVSQYDVNVEDANNNPIPFEVETTVSGTTYTVGGLQSGSEYKFKVRSICGGDHSDWSDRFFFSSAGDGGGGGSGNGGDNCTAIPDGLAVSALSATGATLSWNAVQGATGYEVEVEDGDNTPPFEMNFNTVNTSINVSGLSMGGEYKFKVKAICSSGSSDHSPWFFFNTDGSGGNGGNTGGGENCTTIPSGLAAGNITGTTADLSWNAVSGAVSYEVEVEDDENTPPFMVNINTANTTITIEGLSAGGNYKFKVKAVCSSGSSDHSPWLFFSTGDGGNGGTTPGGGNCTTIPTGLVANAITNTSAELSWNAVEGASGYEVEVEDDQNAPTFLFNANTAATSIIVEGLVEGGQYKFKVKALCGEDSSDHSPWLFFVGGSNGDGGPSTGSCGIPSGLAVSNITDTSAQLTWTAVAGADNYEVEVEDAENTPVFDLQLVTAGTELVVNGLVAGGNYKFKVKSLCDTLSSDHSPLFFFTTSTNGAGGGAGNPGSCAVPQDLTAIDITFDAATLSWGAIEGVTGYEVEIEDNENTTPFNLEVQTENTQIRVSGLVPGGQYQFKVEAICGIESSDHSPWYFFSTTSLINVANAVNNSRLALETISDRTDLIPLYVQVFPNPASDFLQVDLREWPVDRTSQIHLVDFTGRIVFRADAAHGGLLQIPVAGYRAGFYQLVVQSGKSLRTKKFLINH